METKCAGCNKGPGEVGKLRRTTKREHGKMKLMFCRTCRK